MDVSLARPALLLSRRVALLRVPLSLCLSLLLLPLSVCAALFLGRFSAALIIASLDSFVLPPCLLTFASPSLRCLLSLRVVLVRSMSSQLCSSSLSETFLVPSLRLCFALMGGVGGS
eukprot:4408673-Pyramimonas_sp.AAC.1